MGSCHCWSRTSEHSVQCGQVCLYVTHHEMVKDVERVSKKNSLKLNKPLTTTPPVGVLMQMGS